MAEVLEDITDGNITRVRIGRGGQGDAVLLEHQEDGWTVNGYEADSAHVARLLEELESSQVLELAATNPGNHVRMGLDSASADTLEMTTVSGRERRLLIGDSGPRFGTVFARLPGDEAVYLVDGALSSHLGRDVDAWRDRVMVRVDSTRVARLQITRGEAVTILERTDSTWTTADGTVVTGSGVRDALFELARLTASGFVTENDSLAALPEAGRLLAFGATGDTLAAISVGEGGADRWAKVRGDGTIYRITQFRANRLLPTEEALTSRP